jgi:hypothetical protein
VAVFERRRCRRAPSGEEVVHCVAPWQSSIAMSTNALVMLLDVEGIAIAAAIVVAVQAFAALAS